MPSIRTSTREERDDYGAALAGQSADPDQEAARERVRRAAARLSMRDMLDERVKLGRAQGHIC